MGRAARAMSLSLWNGPDTGGSLGRVERGLVEAHAQPAGEAGEGVGGAGLLAAAVALGERGVEDGEDALLRQRIDRLELQRRRPGAGVLLVPLEAVGDGRADRQHPPAG